MRLTFGVVIGMILLSVLGCGGDKSMGPREAKDGRVFVYNTMPETYIHPEGTGRSPDLLAIYVDENLRTIETVIELGQKEEVTRGVIKGGTKVKITIRARRGGEVEEVEVTIDGNVVIMVTALRQNIGFAYEVIKE